MHNLGQGPTATTGGIWDSNQEKSGGAASGTWRQLPNGLIIQEGLVTLASGTAAVVFPLPFPTKCNSFMHTPILSGVAANGTVSSWISAAATKTGVTLNGRLLSTTLGAVSIAAGTFQISWRAEGV